MENFIFGILTLHNWLVLIRTGDTDVPNIRRVYVIIW